MDPLELLIFDLDGTLIDSKKDIAHSVNLTFRDMGLPEKSHEVIYGYVGNGVRQLMIDAVGSQDAELIDQTLHCFETHYLTHLLDETRLYPGLDAVLKHFQNKKRALVTNKPPHYTEKIILGLNVDHVFDSVLCGTPTIRLKPHPEMIFKTLETLETKPSEALMIGDSLNDIYAARAAGVRSCGVAYGFGNPETLKSASPDYFIEAGEELIALFS